MTSESYPRPACGSLTQAEGGAAERRAAAILEAALDCIVTMDAAGRVVEWNAAAERTFGYRREAALGRELAGLIVPVRLRERHREGLARYLASGHGTVIGRRVEMPALHADGSELRVELAITRIAGEPPLFTAYLRDIGARLRAEQLRNVRLAITQAIAQANDIAHGAVAVLQAVCDGLHWQVGAFWRVRGEALCCEAVAVSSAKARSFESASRGSTLARGEGLPGGVWQRAQAAWIVDVQADANLPRRAAAAAAGLRSAFACPVAAGSRALGVLEFFSEALLEPDAELLETMGTIAGHLGQFVERREAELRLRESEERFRALMDQAPFSMQIFSREGRTLHVNPAWSRLWGVTLEDIAEYNVLEDSQLERTGVARELRRAFVGEGAVMLPAIRYDPNETLPDRSRHADPVRYVSAVAYPLKDADGEVREVVLVHEDVTAREHAESALRESEERLRLLADTIPQLAWMAQPDGYIFWYNRRWYEYTGTTAQQMEGWGWQAVHDPNVLPRVLERWKASIATGAAFDMIFPLRGADGVFRPFLTRVNPLRDSAGRIVYWFGTNTDVSDIKRLEEALREADRRKDEFLAMLAHELRNPLAPIRNALQILCMPSIDAGAAARAREIMVRQVEHLVRLVDDLLDVSRVVRGKIELRMQPVEVATLVERAVETAQPLIDARGHRLEVSLPGAALLVEGDPLRLAQVLANLLNNAAKYTEPGGYVGLSARREGAHAVVSVKDNGAGIAADVLERVFDLFVQGDASPTRAHGGLGIGLTLVKELVELHGGMVRAASDGPGKGSEFTVRLPLLPAREASGSGEVPAAAQPAMGERGRRILVVDDNEDAAESFAALLRLHGHEVRVAFDGLNGLELAQRFLPEMVFLDLGMPGMDGYEVARRLRALPRLAGARLAALTGWGQEENRRSSAEAGFDHHLVKPPSWPEVAELIAKLTTRP